MTRPTPSRKTLPVNMYLGCTRLMTMPARIAPISVPAPPTAASGPYKEALTCRFRLTKMMSSAFIAPAPSMAIRARITTMSSTRVFATKRKPTSISRNTAPMALSGTAVVAASAKRGCSRSLEARMARRHNADITKETSLISTAIDGRQAQGQWRQQGQQGYYRAHQVGGYHRATPVPAVDEDSCQWSKQEDGRVLSNQYSAHRRSRMGEHKDPDEQCGAVHEVTHVGNSLPDSQQRKVAVDQQTFRCGNDVGRIFLLDWRFCRHND